MVAQEQRIKELQLLCSQLKEENSSEYEKVHAILEVYCNLRIFFLN